MSHAFFNFDGVWCLNVFFVLSFVQCTVEVDGEVVPLKIVSTRLITDRSTGQSKGFGYVEFGTPEEVGCLLG